MTCINHASCYFCQKCKGILSVSDNYAAVCWGKYFFFMLPLQLLSNLCFLDLIGFYSEVSRCTASK